MLNIYNFTFCYIIIFFIIAAKYTIFYYHMMYFSPKKDGENICVSMEQMLPGSEV